MGRRSRWIILIMAVTFSILAAGAVNAADVRSPDSAIPSAGGIPAANYIFCLSPDAGMYGEKLSENEMEDIEGELSPVLVGAAWGGFTGFITSTLDYLHENDPGQRNLADYLRQSVIGTMAGAVSGAVTAGALDPRAGSIAGSLAAQTTSWILDAIWK